MVSGVTGETGSHVQQPVGLETSNAHVRVPNHAQLLAGKNVSALIVNRDHAKEFPVQVTNLVKLCLRLCHYYMTAHIGKLINILNDGRPNLHLKFYSLTLAVDGEWTEWRDWEPCSRTCGTGTQQRLRSCTRPRPAFGGRDCVGNSRETKTCETRACPGKCML